MQAVPASIVRVRTSTKVRKKAVRGKFRADKPLGPDEEYVGRGGFENFPAENVPVGQPISCEEIWAEARDRAVSRIFEAEP